jgi:hypothetical protein
VQGAHCPDTLSEGQVHEGKHNANGSELPEAIPLGSSKSARAQVSVWQERFWCGKLYDDDLRLPHGSEEHILAMIARVTSPIPGPSSHRQRRKTLRSVARGVMFIQRVKYVFYLSSSCDVFLIRERKTDGQVRSGAPNVRPDLPSRLHSRTCVVEGSSRQDIYSIFGHHIDESYVALPPSRIALSDRLLLLLFWF